MAELKQRLTPKKTSPSVLNVSTSSVNLKTPTVTVEAPQMQLESTVIDALSTAIMNVAKQQAQILTAIEKQTAAIQTLANRKQDINVEAPKVNMPARPSRFYVTLDKEDGDTVGMRIETSSH